MLHAPEVQRSPALCVELRPSTVAPVSAARFDFRLMSTAYVVPAFKFTTETVALSRQPSTVTEAAAPFGLW